MENHLAKQREQLKIELALTHWKEKARLRWSWISLALIILSLLLGAYGVASFHPVTVQRPCKIAALSAGDIVLTRSFRMTGTDKVVFVQRDGGVSAAVAAGFEGDWVCVSNNILMVNGKGVTSVVSPMPLQQIPEGCTLLLIDTENGTEMQMCPVGQILSEVFLRIYPLNTFGGM